MADPQTHIYEFGEFRVDPLKRLLLGRDQRPVPLTPKAFDTLLYLVEHRHAVLDKEMLMKAIWPDTAVEENNLNQNISALRRVLGGKRNENRYIVTVPGRGYRFVAAVTTHKTATPSSSLEPTGSIAVLPFKPLVLEARDVSLEFGMADTLIARLRSIQGIVVRPMSSVRKYVDVEQDALQAGRELGVEWVLEGCLQFRSDKIRVTVSLLNVATEVSAWAGTFDEKVNDIFAVQDVISERVVQSLQIGLSSEDKKRLTKRHTENTEAYQLYLRGRYHWWKTAPEEFKKSRDYFQRAVEADPSYALGYCGLNSYYGYGAAWGMLPPDDSWPKAVWANNKALELDDSLAEAHLQLAARKMVNDLDWAVAEQAAKRAIELNPQFDEIHYLYSFYLVVMGRFEEAIAAGKRALACEPFSLRINQHLGSTFYYARRQDEAIHQYQQTIELDPNNAGAHEALGDAYREKGAFSDAVAEWGKAMAVAGDAELASILSDAYKEHGFKSAVRAVARKRLERLNERAKRGDYVTSISFARAYIGLDEKKEALDWLKQACEERNVYRLMIGCDPLYDMLRSDPQFLNLLQRMKLEHQPTGSGTTESRAPSCASIS
jgi:DNA-binding winged helix-turn-helix (wHTH) protein/tetratricopeptide (TPR) repeat protein